MVQKERMYPLKLFPKTSHAKSIIYTVNAENHRLSTHHISLIQK